MQATAHHPLIIRNTPRLAWGLFVACLLAASLPVQAANGRNPSGIQAARAASAAKAGLKVAQAPVAPAKPTRQR